ncbi:MAG: ABC transporter ATP-binding protein [Actinobacteria bacterium]|nr:ABC transporter ATP-binding protein [Actinomycetota bacterium]
MGAPVIAVDSVSKRFRLHHEKYSSLKERAIHGGRIPYEEFWALRDVSLEVFEGETVGIVGQNGSGKSTLLKCIAGILQPTKGEVRVRGQVAAMLDLGAGFQPELSGRDNVFLNGALLGLQRKEIERRFDEIVAFSELEQFIDNQVKFYSSGMYVRLGFAVAVSFEPDVLLVDEVLAVGDERFQAKCLERIKHLQDQGSTILFVSHAASVVRQICERAVVLESGKKVMEGTPGEAIRVFREQLVETELAVEMAAGTARGDGSGEDSELSRHQQAVLYGRTVAIRSVTVSHPGVGTRRYLLPGERLEVRVAYEMLRPVDDVVFGIAILNSRSDLVFASDTEILGERTTLPVGAGEVAFIFDSVPLLDGTYQLHLGIRSLDGGIMYDFRETKDYFEVMNPAKTLGEVAMPLRAELRPLIERSSEVASS